MCRRNNPPPCASDGASQTASRRPGPSLTLLISSHEYRLRFLLRISSSRDQDQRDWASWNSSASFPQPRRTDFALPEAVLQDPSGRPLGFSLHPASSFRKTCRMKHSSRVNSFLVWLSDGPGTKAGAGNTLDQTHFGGNVTCLSMLAGLRGAPRLFRLHPRRLCRSQCPL